MGILALAIVLAVASVGYLQVSTSVANNEIVQHRESQAFWAAQSGLLLGVEWLQDADNLKQAKDLFTNQRIDDIVPGCQINGDIIEVDVIRTASGFTIQSTALSNGNIGFDKVVAQQAEPGGIPWDTAALDNAILSDGPLDLNGGGDVSQPDGSDARIHSNQKIIVKNDITGGVYITSCVEIEVGNDDIDGSVEAPVLDIHSQADITGDEIEGPVDPIPFPDIDLDPWREYALANGEVHSGTWSTATYTPTGGVLWIDGDVHISNAGTINGQLIATGDIKMSGGSVIGPDTGFALASVSGDIEIQTQGSIEGCVYAKAGNYKQTSGGSLLGQLIIKGTIDKGGGSDVIVFRKTRFSVPGGGDNSSTTFVDGTWQQANVVPE